MDTLTRTGKWPRPERKSHERRTFWVLVGYYLLPLAVLAAFAAWAIR